MPAKIAFVIASLLVIVASGVMGWRLATGPTEATIADRDRAPLARHRAPHVSPSGLSGRPTAFPAGVRSSAAPADEAVVRKLCAECHLFPDPAVQPRSSWALTISRMSRDPLFGKNMQQPYDLAAIVAWYEQQAPDEHLLESAPAGQDAGPVPFERRGLTPASSFPDGPTVSNVRLVDLEGDERLELLVADMRHGVILSGRPYDPSSEFATLASAAHPAHVEVVDLDADGRRDLLVANLGTLIPEDHTRGTVEWLRQVEGGRFESFILADGLGRVSDAQPADFDGDGDLDVAVAEFGQIATGSVTVLENRTESWDRPDFQRHRVDPRHGATHVPVVDLDGDGRLDFVALLAQEHEMVVAYLNRGGFRFETRLLSRAPHPEWGSTGITAVDLDSDGDSDFLLTNGDTLDTGRAHPDHGIEWLENRGDLVFERHRITTLYGAQAAKPADLDGDGDLDLVACAFLDRKPRPDLRFVSLAWWEQVRPGEFRRHILETDACLHMTLDAADYDGDGRPDLVVGNADVFQDASAWAMLLKNVTAPP